MATFFTRTLQSVTLHIHCLLSLKFNVVALGFKACYLHLKKISVIGGMTLKGVGRDSSVGIATAYGLESPGIESRWW
jgi:hypothetical protein